jgi:hypothetical protein
MVTHAERMDRLRAKVDAIAMFRIGQFLGRPATDSDRVAYRPASYAAVTKIEKVAQSHLRNLRRALRSCDAFATSYERGTGGLTAEALADLAADQLSELVARRARDAVTPATTGSTYVVRPTRWTFVQEALADLAESRGLESGADLSPQVLAAYTLASGAFWPYGKKAEMLWEKDGYPTAAKVVAKEAEMIRKFLRRRTSPQSAL